MRIIKRDLVRKIYGKRDPNSKKYDFGIVTIIGGGEFYTGAPALSGLAAFRAGADMVHIIAPVRAADVIASFSPNLSSYRLEGKWFSEKDVPAVVSMVKSAEMVSNGKSAVVIGGGLGRSEETQKAVRNFIGEINSPCIIDADGIYAIAGETELIRGKNFLLTPNSYEFYVLTNEKIRDFPLEKKIEIGRKKAIELGATILLKGKEDMIFSKSREEEPFVNKTGSSVMTKGGTGDTLAGIAGALASRNIDLFTVAAVASYINGTAGELAAKEKGESMLATDLIENIPKVIAK